jgi:hypothetical protein
LVLAQSQQQRRDHLTENDRRLLERQTVIRNGDGCSTAKNAGLSLTIDHLVHPFSEESSHENPNNADSFNAPDLLSWPDDGMRRR